MLYGYPIGFNPPASGTPPAAPLSVLEAAVPPGFSDEPGVNYTLGFKAASSVPGSIVGLRYYKHPDLDGAARQGGVWGVGADSGPLGTLTFAGESASGWQEQLFAAPIAVAADTPFIIGVYFPDAYYGFQAGALAAADITNGPLTVFQSGTLEGPPGQNGNGLFADGVGALTRPNETFGSTLYFVDFLFQPD